MEELLNDRVHPILQPAKPQTTPFTIPLHLKPIQTTMLAIEVTLVHKNGRILAPLPWLLIEDAIELRKTEKQVGTLA